MSPRRLALAGIATESSTFSPLRTERFDFRIFDGSRLSESPAAQDFLSVLPNTQLAGGFLARAMPGGPLSPRCYQELKQQLLEALAQAAPEGLLLDLHGAMFVEGLQDAEADLLRDIRGVVGDLPIIAAMDPHGNISPELCRHLDALTAYRTAPHIDVRETRQRAARLLSQRWEGVRWHVAYQRIPVLLTGEQTSTEWSPGKEIWAEVESCSQEPGMQDASLFVGYAWADEPRAAAAAICYASTPEQAQKRCAQLAQRYWEARRDFQSDVPLWTPEQAFRWAEEPGERPVVLSDASDNPTAGGVGDSAELLKAALASGVARTLIAGVADAPAVRQVQHLPECAQVQLRVGASLDASGESVEVDFHLVKSAPDDGRGACVVLRSGAVTVVLTEQRRTFHLQEDFTRLGLIPESFAVVVVKLGYLVPEVAQFARRHALVVGSGCVPPDITGLSFTHLPRGTYPFSDTESFTAAPTLLT